MRRVGLIRHGLHPCHVNTNVKRATHPYFRTFIYSNSWRVWLSLWILSKLVPKFIKIQNQNPIWSSKIHKRILNCEIYISELEQIIYWIWPLSKLVPKFIINLKIQNQNPIWSSKIHNQILNYERLYIQIRIDSIQIRMDIQR